MHHHKTVDQFTVLEAVNQVARAADMEGVSTGLEGLMWHGPEYAADNRERLKKAFAAILEYFHRLYERDRGSLSSIDVQQGIQAIMLLTAEAAQKMDLYTQEMGKKEESILQLKEYQELQKFYAGRMASRSQTPLALHEGWQEPWKELSAGGMFSSEPHALTWDKVCQDQSPELFLIHSEGGKFFFSSQLLRHLHWVGAFDRCLSELSGDDLFLRLEWVLDWNRHETAREVLDLIRTELDDYLKVALRHKGLPLVNALNQAVMALMLAANPRHLKQSGTLKSCSQYFADFHRYLREALISEDVLAQSPVDFAKSLTRFQRALNEVFFNHSERYKDLASLWKGLLKEGSQEVRVEGSTKSPESLWNEIADEDALVRAALKKHPNGPLMQSIELLTSLQGKEIKMGYDPISQGYLPGRLYSIPSGDRQVDCLRIPTPVRQEVLGCAYVTEEFKKFLRTDARHLMVLLEDPLSPLAAGRCAALNALEEIEQGTLLIVNLPRSGDFYTQSGEYLAEDRADRFMESLSAYPIGISLTTPEIILDIHRRFFGSKLILTRKNRQDFIEIFYHSIVRRLMEEYQPDTLSFTCKDGIDASSAAAAGFYVFCQGGSRKDELIEWLYGPALFLRHRAIELSQLERFLSGMILRS